MHVDSAAVRPQSSLRLILLALLLTACAGEVQPVSPPDDRSARVSSLFEHCEEGVQPGAAVMVISNGEVVYSRGFGYADVANKVPITADSTFRLGSVSKQFTAVAIMVLAEAGKLSYDDPLIDYLPQVTKYPGITIRHLLTHTAGLPDYYDTVDTSSGMPSNADLADFLATMDGPVFPPGQQHEYSNPGYEMLSLIVEKASGMEFRNFMTEHVFRPAGMDNSLIHDHTEPAISNRVFGYDKTDAGFQLNDYDPLNGIVGSGSMYATLEDFYAWDQALYTDDVIPQSALAEAHARATLNNGDQIDYGFGWRLDQRRGHRRLAHGGSWVGFRTGTARYPDDELTIVVLTNRSDADPDAYIDAITDIYLPDRGDEFRPAGTVAAVQEHHRQVSTDDIWWTVTGEQMAWMHRNAHQLFPTVNVYRNGPVSALAYENLDAIGNYVVDTADGPMPFGEFLVSDQSTALGVVILHKGKIAFESYPRMREHEKPTYWSVAKVITGTVVRILEERGDIDVSKPIEAYIPELAESAFAGIKIRNILDMATGLDCYDEYVDRQSCYYRYSMAIGDGFREDGAPDNPYEFVTTLKVTKHAEQGTQFSYSGVNTFVLAWLVEKVTGLPFPDVVTKEIWYHIGAEADAAYIAYRYGIPVTHGGFLAKMRDLARFGLLFTPSYKIVSDHKIISDEHVELIRSGGNPALRVNAGMSPVEESGIKHNVYQWSHVDVNGNFYQAGWGGQGLIVNPERDVVAVFTSYFKDDYSEVPLESAVFEVLEGVFGHQEKR